MIFKPEGRRFYSVKFKHDGRLIVKRTKATTAKAARNIEGQIRSELAMGHFEILKPRPESPTLADFLKKDFTTFNESRFAEKPSTLAYYAYGVKQLSASDLGKLKLSEITSQHAAGFAAAHSKLSKSTVNCGLRTLRRALNLALEWGKLEHKPKMSLAKGERQRDRILTEGEFLAYRDACRQPWRDVVTLLYGTGMRPGEAYALRWEHVLLNGTGGLIQIVAGKTQAARRLLPMVPEVYRMLTERSETQKHPTEGWVFPSGSACGHFDESSAKNQHIAALHAFAAAHKSMKSEKSVSEIAKAAKIEESLVHVHYGVIEAGLKAFPPYTLRHTALTRLAEAGCDAFTLAKIAGHSSITITQRYCHPQAEAIERAFAKLVPESRQIAKA